MIGSTGRVFETEDIIGQLRSLNDLSSILEKEKCGITYNSSVGDPPLLMSKRGSELGVLGLFFWIGLIVFCYWLRYYRRKQAEKRFIRRVQAAVNEVQQPRAVYFVVNPSAADTPLTHEEPPCLAVEEPPPSFQEIQK